MTNLLTVEGIPSPPRVSNFVHYMDLTDRTPISQTNTRTFTVVRLPKASKPKPIVLSLQQHMLTSHYFTLEYGLSFSNRTNIVIIKANFISEFTLNGMSTYLDKPCKHVYQLTKFINTLSMNIDFAQYFVKVVFVN